MMTTKPTLSERHSAIRERMQDDPDRLLSTEEAAALLGISVTTLNRIAGRREIELIRVGKKKVMYRRSALTDWVALKSQGVQQ